MQRARRLQNIAIALTIASAATAAFAGPPLICWKVETGGSPSLPWNSRVSNSEGAKEDYDTKNLAGDTLTLLEGDPSVLAHMETIRRAAIYAKIDRKAGQDLFHRLVARAGRKGGANGNPIDQFDAGYFAEAWNQAEGRNRPEFWPKMMRALGLSSDHNDGLGGATGYDWVKEAIAETKGYPDMEYAAALITWWPKKPEHESHIAKAAAGAQPGTPLETNLLKNFSDRGTTLAALRALETKRTSEAN